jgi:TatD DNase family protein
MQIVDSHCHINFPELVEDIDGLLTRMRENNVVKALCVSVQLEKFQEILDLSIKYPHVYASVGVHPDNKIAKNQPLKNSYHCRTTRKWSL